MTETGGPLQHENLSDFLEVQEQSFRLTPEEAPAAVEALLFAAGDPLPAEKLRQITGLDRTLLDNILNAMADRYLRDRHRGVMLREVDGAWMLCTKPGMTDVLQRMFQPRHRPPLSQAAYETLAIIAYNQPVTRAQVEAVRGVNSDSIISRLAERNLICEAGTLDAPGRPTLFATTEQFLMDFGLRTVKDLPPMEMLMYGTLRDFEQSLETAAGHGRDKQITIEQLVHTLLPEALQQTPPPADMQEDTAPSALPDEEVLELSEALFGEYPLENTEES